ncbi:MAG: hypothetical protein AAGC55_03785 [Myxococcota bacterium]
MRLFAAAGSQLFSASDHGLVRWQLESGRSLWLGTEQGLPGDRVEAMTFDRSRNWLWLATNGGISRYDVDGGFFEFVQPPPSDFGLDSFDGVALAPSGDGGLWIGHLSGLYYTNSSGQWSRTSITESVGAVLRTREGYVWIGTESGLVMRQPDGEFRSLAGDAGCQITAVRIITLAPGGGLLAVGENSEAQQRIAMIRDDSCTVFRASPDRRWLATSANRDELVILTARRLYSARTSLTGARSLTREGMRLLPVQSESKVSPPVIRALDIPLPVREPKGLLALADEIFIGTQYRGIVRLSYGKGVKRQAWLRRNLLAQSADRLSVACRGPSDCYLVTGAPGTAWRYTGEGFEPAGLPGSQPLAVVRDQDERLYALVRSLNERRIELYRNREGNVWVQVRSVKISTPGSHPNVSVARFSPGGQLWIGLRYRDRSGEERPFGMAVVDIRSRRVTYHRANPGRVARRAGWPIPLEVSEVAFASDREVWLATSEGAVQAAGRRKVVVHNEADGFLDSDVLRDLVISKRGRIVAATRNGVTIYDGERWKSPRALRRSPVNGLAVLPDDARLWMATDDGVAVYDGKRVVRIDERRGLLENQIDEITSDHLGRLWVRGSQGITLIRPR